MLNGGFLMNLIVIQENYDFNDQLRSQMRNGVTLMELDQCDVAVTPSMAAGKFLAHQVGNQGHI